MPEQGSTRGLQITTSQFENPFATEIYPYGLGGLNLKDQLDQIPVGEFSRMTNLIHTKDRGLQVRPGLTSFATGGIIHHSVRRLSDPQAGTYTRIWGVDQSIYRAQSGALGAAIDTGYSGDPLYLLPHRPPLSGDPWMFVADRIRMRKVREDGLVTLIGLPAPGAAPVAVATAEATTPIAAFEVIDGTDAAGWAGFSGPDRDGTGQSGNPTIYDASGISGQCVNLATVVDAAQTGYLSGMSHGFIGTLDLTVLSGPITSTDDDLIHWAVRCNRPDEVSEIRLYFVCSAFTPAKIPGVESGFNESAYVRAFRSSDYADFIANQSTAQQGTENVRNAFFLEGYATPATNVAEDPSIYSLAGSDTWTEYGVVDLPLRKGDFLKIGNAGKVGTDWSTITGLVIVVVTKTAEPLTFAFDDLYLRGGYGPDTTEPGAEPYDWRFTHYDPRTGAEGNPCPVMLDANKLELLRQRATLTPAAYGDGAIRQRFYRRGGSLNENWFFLGTNASDGGVFTDTFSDDSISSAGTVNIDHYQPVPTVDDAGNTVLAQPVPVLFGPVNGILFGLGDPYRPGHLYWCFPDEPDHWGAENNLEVCSPSEELMAGFVAGSQAFCFSRERLYAIYPNLSDTTVMTVTPTACKRGLVGRWAWTIGLGGIYGVARDGIFKTSGGGEEIISNDILPLFRDTTWNGYSPVDFHFPLAIRLSIYQDILYFQYQGTDGNRHVLAYSILFDYWTDYDFAIDTNYLLPDDDTALSELFIGGLSTGVSYTHEGFSDAGVAITFRVRNGAWDLGRPREDKLLGDQILDADFTGYANCALTNRLNNETVINATQGFDVAAGRSRFILDSFGTVPQRARNISTEITGSSATNRAVLYFLGQSTILEPDVTINRMTQWDDLGHPDEKYLTGVTFDCDTGNVTRTILIESDYNGQINLVAALSVTSDGRHKFQFSWPAVQCHKIRIRPNDDCKAWILYKADWIKLEEPPRIAKWDIHFEADGDQYYTGLDLFCDTGNLEKQIQVFVDGVQLQNPYTGEMFWRITANGRQWRHLTFLAGRGHVFHFIATDDNPGLLYKHKWFLDQEPSEQYNWNQNYSVHGTLADKWFKAFLFETDTFGQNKSVDIDIDGTVVETLTVNTNGRKVVHLALSQQRLGRVLRVYPTDGNPSRPYTIIPIFDVEPYSLTRWETQEGDDGIPGYKTWLEGNISLVSTADVLLTMTIQRNQTRGTDGTWQTRTYVIPSTSGVKLDRFVAFLADKGTKRKFLFTSPSAFRLYREESTIVVQPWMGGDPMLVHPFGNDDQDVTRGMTVASLAAARSGGGTQ